jgi:hypothetical protein
MCHDQARATASQMQSSFRSGQRTCRKWNRAIDTIVGKRIKNLARTVSIAGHGWVDSRELDIGVTSRETTPDRGAVLGTKMIVVAKCFESVA